ncbi:unnamed protein product, partial [Vitis vinifera]
MILNRYYLGMANPKLAPEASADFPTLATAAATKSKKKKGQTLSLSEFSAFGAGKSAQPSQTKGLTHEDLMMLPTGPRQRSAEELDRGRLGGGFRSYGSNGSGSEERRQGGFGRDSSRELAPSRADEIDDWGAAKKSTVGNGFERRDRGGFFDSQSRADESASWEEGSGNANGSAGSRPKLILQPRTVPVNDGQQPGSGSVAKPKGPNPFGEARPREEVLAEKGQDWKEIEEKLESVKLKDVGSPGVGQTDGPSFGKRSFGSGNARASLPESRSEKSWRKPESEDVRAAKTEDEHEEKTQD